MSSERKTFLHEGFHNCFSIIIIIPRHEYSALSLLFHLLQASNLLLNTLNLEVGHIDLDKVGKRSAYCCKFKYYNLIKISPFFF